MALADPQRSLEDALAEQRAFVLAFGGFSLSTAGGTLVVNERLPVPPFNFVQDVQVSRGRQSAFFERALDFYFQRAIRPTFRVREPVAPHVDQALGAFGFRRRKEPFSVLHAGRELEERPVGKVEVARAKPSDLETIAAFFTHERERDEFRRCIEVLWENPNPEEELVPMLAWEAGRPVGATLLYRHRRTAGLHAVATAEGARGRGIASAVVAHAAARELPDECQEIAITADSARLAARLVSLGFRLIGRYAEYELPKDATLAIPPVGPPG
ncbi:MAG: GNAT family N-acetyltransferase, partial [Candidatus Lutacidiplasmatales archaeon]